MTVQQPVLDSGPRVNPQANGRTAAGAPPATGRHPRFDAALLVVDDQPANVALLERMLSDAGYHHVHGMTDPREVVDACARLSPDLVLLDLHMPHRDGVDVIHALRESMPPHAFLPVLVLTADSNRDARERALAAGAKDFVTKPFDRTEVLLRVRNLLDTKALHRQLDEDNAKLQAEVEAHAESARCLEKELIRRHRRIDDALRPGALSMLFQPVVDLTSGDVVGVEALARFGCEPRRPPNEWFADAVDVDRATELEVAALRVALPGLDMLPPDAFLSLNVSPATAVDRELLELLDHLPAERIVLELTEHERVADYHVLLDALDAPRRRGMRLAVDDAGAGYAGLQHVLRLRPDIIKLDRSLIRDIEGDAARRALASSLVAFGTEVGADVVAEGIETAEELATLQSLGIPYGQGFFLGRPGTLPPVRPDGSHSGAVNQGPRLRRPCGSSR